MDAEIAAVD